jgi:hypothetical protein
MGRQIRDRWEDRKRQIERHMKGREEDRRETNEKTDERQIGSQKRDKWGGR